MAASCEVDLERVRGLQLLLDPDGTPLRVGDPLPPLWHWAALPRWADPAGTGADGHPLRPDALAGVTAVRRMFAGGQVWFADDPVRIGDRVTVSTEVGEVTTKSGRSGEFVLASFETVVAKDGQVLLRERQDVVYTDPRPGPAGAPSGPLPVVGRPFVALGNGSAELRTDPSVLLRFSALTANAHRIHYDLAYAQQIEKLPGLLVHGPLMSLALVQLTAGRAVRRITHRSLSPLYCGQLARLHATESDGVVTAEITGPGDPAVKCRVTIEEQS
ncbi:MaoC family dehydratase N-terminal domain-containing protein [Kribbella sp. NPDC051137]|uniref:FAS1-like dehydratase domain-containing protein n=1 Tax=Kribbella sp. NPDC051137 TaxID=3155045 RepID=UPI003422C14D